MDTKRIKRLIYAKPHKALVLNEPGLSAVTEREVTSLMAAPLQPLDDAPQLMNTDDGIELSCLSFRRLLELAQRLQTAPDFFWVLAEKRVASPGELRKALTTVAWDLVLPSASPVRVQADSRGSRLYHEGLMRETAESFLTEQGFTIDAEAGARIKLLLRENRLMIALALYQDPLYKRGNKSALRATAPLKETLAAGLMHDAVAWLRDRGLAFPRHVYVPFAGSGTLGLEALAVHGGFTWHAFFKAPVIAASPCYPAESAAFIARRLLERAKAASPLSVHFLDHHDEMVGVLEKTVEKVAPCLAPDVRVLCEQGDFFALPLPDGAFLPLHPPYGERLGVANVEDFYRRIAAKLCEAKEISGFILVPDERAWSTFLKNLHGFVHETFHVTQGGKDIRVVRLHRSGR